MLARSVSFAALPFLLVAVTGCSSGSTNASPEVASARPHSSADRERRPRFETRCQAMHECEAEAARLCPAGYDTPEYVASPIAPLGRDAVTNAPTPILRSDATMALRFTCRRSDASGI